MRPNSKASLIFSIVFVLSLCLPLVGMLFPAINFSPEINEKRVLSRKPSFDLNDISLYPEKFEAYFDDYFGFRNLLISLNNLIKLKIFNVSGSPKVLAGKDGWLFFTGDKNIEDYSGELILSQSELERWKTALEKKQKSLKAIGIEYLFVIAPNKSSVYPEYLPEGINRLGPTVADQLVSFLKHNANIRFLDLRTSLANQKHQGKLYFRLDSHWNELGAYYAYKEIISHISTRIPNADSIDFEELSISLQKKTDLGLDTMLGLQDYLKESCPVVEIKSPTSIITDKGDHEFKFTTEIPQSDSPRALVFRDSFTTLLAKYLSESFSYVRYAPNPMYINYKTLKLIEETKPDVVIEEWAERNLKLIDYVN